MDKVKAFEKTVICFTCPFCNHYDEYDSDKLHLGSSSEVECDNCEETFEIYFDWE